MTLDEAQNALKHAEQRYVRARHGGDAYSQGQAADAVIEARRQLKAAKAAAVETWRAVLGFPAEAAVTRADIDANFRERAQAAHPDHGGSHEAMAALNAARAAALAQISPQ